MSPKPKTDSKYFGKLQKHNILMLVYALLALGMGISVYNDPPGYSSTSMHSMANMIWMISFVGWVMPEIERGAKKVATPNILYMIVLVAVVSASTTLNVLSYNSLPYLGAMNIANWGYAIVTAFYVLLMARGMRPFTRKRTA